MNGYSDPSGDQNDLLDDYEDTLALTLALLRPRTTSFRPALKPRLGQVKMKTGVAMVTSCEPSM